jgi:hypothetical protein
VLPTIPQGDQLAIGMLADEDQDVALGVLVTRDQDVFVPEGVDVPAADVFGRLRRNPPLALRDGNHSHNYRYEQDDQQ